MADTRSRRSVWLTPGSTREHIVVSPPASSRQPYPATKERWNTSLRRLPGVLRSGTAGGGGVLAALFRKTPDGDRPVLCSPVFVGLSLR